MGGLLIKFFQLGFWSEHFFLIVSFPDHCLLLPFCNVMCIFFPTWCLCLNLIVWIPGPSVLTIQEFVPR